MSKMWERVAAVISKPEGESRGELEMDLLIPWLRKCSSLLQSCERSVLMEILRHCGYRRCVTNELIIRHGEIGDSFFIMLNGRTSVFIDTTKTGEDSGSEKEEEQTGNTSVPPPSPSYNVVTDRRKLGKFIMKYEAGKSFGEVALISKDAVRNASVIADEPTDLLVIHRELFNRCLKARQEAEYNARKEFVDQCPLFAGWSGKFKHLLQLSLRRETVPTGCHIVTQAKSVQGLAFLVSGQGKVVLEPARYRLQYPGLCDPPGLKPHPMESFIQQYRTKAQIEAREKARLRQAREALHSQDGKDRSEKFLDLCQVREMETIGDIETVMGLESYVYSVVSICPCDVFFLDVKNVERLVKRNIQTFSRLRQQVKVKLLSRSNMRNGQKVALLRNLYDKLHAIEEAKAEQAKKDKGENGYMNKLLNLFVHHKLPFVEPANKESVHLLYRTQEKNKVLRAQERERVRVLRERATLQSQESQLRPGHRRKARSIRELQKLNGSDLGLAIPETETLRPETATGDGETADVSGVFITELPLKTDETPEITNHDDPAQQPSNTQVSYAARQIQERRTHPPGPRKLVRPQSAPPSSGMTYEEEDAFDHETSDHSLRALEDRIRDFHDRHADAGRFESQIVELKRFEINPNRVPMQGGTVFVRSKACRYRRDQYVSPEHHQHVRRFIIPKRANRKFRRAIESTGTSGPKADTRKTSEHSRPTQRPFSALPRSGV